MPTLDKEISFTVNQTKPFESKIRFALLYPDLENEPDCYDFSIENLTIPEQKVVLTEGQYYQPITDILNQIIEGCQKLKEVINVGSK